jgi:molecular chaperone HtpG
LDKVGCKRIDADTTERLIDKDEKPVSVLSKEQEDAVKKMFEEQLKTTPSAMVQLEAMSASEPPVQIVKPEFIRRMAEMQQFQGMNFGDMGGSYNVVVNTNHPTIAAMEKLDEGSQKQTIEYLHHVALLANGLLKGQALHEFVLGCYAKIK